MIAEADSQVVERNLPWNFRWGVVNGVMFRFINTLVNPSLVMVVLLAHLTDNPIILGMPMALWTGGFMLSQLAISGHIRRLTCTLPLYRKVSLLRAIEWLLLIVAMVVFADQPDALLGAVMLFLVIVPLTRGLSGLAFYEVVSKVIPPRLRGPFFSWRQSLGGLLALGGSWFVQRVLADDSPLGFPANFTLIFGVAAVLSIVGVMTFHTIREPETKAHPPLRTGLRASWGEAREILREDMVYRRFVLARLSLLLAAGTAPLIIVYAGARFGLPLDTAPIFLMVDALTGLIAVAASGWLSLRRGNRWLIRAAALLGLGIFALLALAENLPLGASGALPFFLLIYLLLAAYNGASSISFAALNLNIPPPDKRPLYVGLSGTIFGLGAYLSLAQGVIVAVLGYRALFVLALALAGFAIWQLGGLYDPTHDGEPVRVRH
jgi:MFS family permease